MKNHIIIIVSLFVIVLLQSCAVKSFKSDSMPITHELWDSLLQDHVTTEGNVNYKGFIQDSVRFNKYLRLLSNHHPYKKNWSKDERLAYWINAYNAFTVKLIIDNYPVKSIKDIKSGIPFINDVWEIEFFKIEGQSYNLNNLEHGIVRKRFDDPRIHAAFNCASFSCPRLRNEAFTAKRLDEQLDDQMRYFINNKDKNILDPKNPKLSKIFKWYGGDFKDTGMSVREWINKYAEVKIEKGAKIDHLDYLWNLNE
ncbi:MAG: DUF547 domain-containing protein [Saprospiraceae bacterium]